MVTRWHLLHLPVSLQGKTGRWGWVEDVLVRWPEGVIEGIGVHANVNRYYVPAADIAISAMGIHIRQRKSVEKHSRLWWNARHQQKVIMNQPIWSKTGELVGRVKDFMIDEVSLAVHDIVVSQGVLEDLLHGALIVSTRELVIDFDGRIKIISNRAV